jgi:hypothetical protein
LIFAPAFALAIQYSDFPKEVLDVLSLLLNAPPVIQIAVLTQGYDRKTCFLQWMICKHNALHRRMIMKVNELVPRNSTHERVRILETG